MKPTAMLMGTVSLLCACQTLQLPGSTGRLKREISMIETRVLGIEAAVDSATGPLSNRNAGIHTQVRYRPLIEWADSFSTGPAVGRTVTFQQTGSTGYIVRQSKRCRPFGGSRPGYYAEIDGGDVTRASVQLRRFTIRPRPNGLALGSTIRFDARTQIQGQFEAPCVPGSIGTTVGVTGEAEPTAVLLLRLAGAEGNAARYTVDLESPNRVGVEMAFGLNGFGRVRFTLPMEGLARQITSGSIGLLFDDEGKILLPDGQVVGYRVATLNPQLSTDTTGVQFSTDVHVAVERRIGPAPSPRTERRQ
jgi:hypothetical protein